MATTKTTSRHAASAPAQSDTKALEAKVASLEADIAALRKDLAAVKAAKAAPAAGGGNWVDREEWGKWRRVVAKKIGVRL
jgi:hypothetical protein